MEKLVSVIIPVYNVKAYLDQCVDSVLKQTYSNMEVILSDDGSTDGSGEQCDRWAEADKRVKVIHEKNGGLSAARNRGIDIATGDYMVFIDSDDYWDGQAALAGCMACLAESGADMLVFGYSKLFEATGAIRPVTPIGLRSAVLGKTKTEAFDYLTTQNIHVASAWSRITRAELIKNRNHFEHGVTSEDIEWTAKLVLAARSIDYYPQNFYIYRQRAGSITKTMTKSNIVQLQRIIGKCIDHGKAIETDEFYPIYMGYTAYQYITSLANAYKLGKEELKCVFSTLVSQSWVLRFGKNRRVRMIAAAKKLLGFRAMFAILRVYYTADKR